MSRLRLMTAGTRVIFDGDKLKRAFSNFPVPEFGADAARTAAISR